MSASPSKFPDGRYAAPNALDEDRGVNPNTHTTAFRASITIKTSPRGHSPALEDGDQITAMSDSGEQYSADLPSASDFFNAQHAVHGQADQAAQVRIHRRRFSQRAYVAAGRSNSTSYKSPPPATPRPYDRRTRPTERRTAQPLASAAAEQQCLTRGRRGASSGRPGAPSVRTHYDVEKRYRANLNDKFDELRDCPVNARAYLSEDYRPDAQADGTEGQLRMSRVQVLMEAVEYIHHLEEANDWATEYIEEVKAEQLQTENFGTKVTMGSGNAR